MLKSLWLAGVLAFGLTTTAQAQYESFESGDLTGWDAPLGLVEVVTEADDAVVTPPFGEHFTAVGGTYFARLTAFDTEQYTTLSKSFSTNTGELSFFAAFLAFDYLPYDDDAYVRVFSDATNLVVAQWSITSVGDYGHTSWQLFEAMLAPGDYTFEAGIREGLEPGGSSQLLLDEVRLPGFVIEGGPVPEPASWALLILGFAFAGTMLRRRSRAQIGRGA